MCDCKIVPCLLTAELKDDHVTICTDLRERARNDSNFMSSVITGDECRVCGYDPEMKHMSSQLNMSSSRPKKARQVKSNVKTILIAFFYTDLLVHHEYVPRGYRVKKNSTEESSNACTALCGDIAQRSGAPAIGSCTMKMPLHTGLLLQVNFWRERTLRRSNTLRTPLTLFHAPSSFPGTEENNKMSLIRLH